MGDPCGDLGRRAGERARGGEGSPDQIRRIQFSSRGGGAARAQSAWARPREISPAPVTITGGRMPTTVSSPGSGRGRRGVGSSSVSWTGQALPPAGGGSEGADSSGGASSGAAASAGSASVSSPASERTFPGRSFRESHACSRQHAFSGTGPAARQQSASETSAARQTPRGTSAQRPTIPIASTAAQRPTWEAHLRMMVEG